MKSSHVPHRSLNQSHATFMPDTAQAVSRFPLSLSWCRDSHQFWRRPIVFDTSSDGLLALVSLIHSWSRLAGPFPQRSPPWLLTTAAWGALKPAPESRLRGAFPHLLCSLVAHYLQHIHTFEPLKNLWYSILITTQKGESEPVDLPFLSPQNRIFRASGLTPDLKIRYGSDIHLVSAIISLNVIVGSFSIYQNLDGKPSLRA